MGKIIAFVPVRGGSKSIPLKNIKSLAGYPLVFWVLSALSKSVVDEIIVATDSDDIENTVNQFNLPKVIVYRRLPENASDIASTESVMLEYIKASNLSDSTIFMLVQATSPLTRTSHFNDAIHTYKEGKFDSMLTCVRSYRFFWDAKGRSVNYDYMNRPRRQDYEGQLMENGAFYISKVGNIQKSGNRLCGTIGVYEMPEYTAFEIDEPDDWLILEKLVYKYNDLPINTQSIKKIKLFLTDVDGVLTDGGMYYDELGNESKRFNTKDGMAFELLRNENIKTGIVTSESTSIVERRAAKIKADFVCQGKKYGGKLTAVQEICDRLQISIKEVAYIGDDINCTDLLIAVGLKACPSDAVQAILEVPNILVMNRAGGKGCTREFADYILKHHK